MPVHAIIFDLGGTLIDWPDWDDDAPRRWRLAYAYFAQRLPRRDWPEPAAFTQAMRDAELAHWEGVRERCTSGTATDLVRDGFDRLGVQVSEQEVMTVLDGYAHAISDWSIIFPDSVPTLLELRKRGYRLGLLSNTWWASEWHNADLALHGLDALLDVVVYTSELPHSKPHPQVFYSVTERLGVTPRECMMVGDRLDADIKGGQEVGMRTVWKKPEHPWPSSIEVTPDAVITDLSELLSLLPLLE
ncbi:MAG: HAD family hydrolase [Ktedonobacteraceae bacterium]|nr:HAD family hydrolase [Ktedonobacteraceae bacterium]